MSAMVSCASGTCWKRYRWCILSGGCSSSHGAWQRLALPARDRTSSSTDRSGWYKRYRDLLACVFSTWAHTNSVIPSLFPDLMALEQSSEIAFTLQPTKAGEKWYVSFAHDVLSSVVTLRCCTSSRSSICERMPYRTSFMPFEISQLEGMEASL